MIRPDGYRFVTCMLVLLPLVLGAQNLDRQVADAIADLTRGSAEDCLGWCDRLVEPEARAEKDDTAARMVLHGATLKAGEESALRSALVEAFTTVLRSQRSNAVHAFVLDQLQLIADAHCLPAVAPHLRNPVLTDRAVRVVVAVGGAAAVETLNLALAEPAGSARLSVIQGLADLGSERAVEALIEVVGSDDHDLRIAGLRALAATGAAQAHDTLLQALRDPSAHVRAQALNAYLSYLRKRLAAGQREETMTRALALAQAHEDAPHVRCGVLDLLGRTGGSGAVEFSVAALADQDPRVRTAAARALKQLPVEQTAPRLIRMLMQAPVEQRVPVVDILAEIRAESALPALRRQLDQEHPAVRAAAIRASAAIVGQQALPELIPLLTDEREGVPEAASDAILRLPGEAVGQALAEAAEKAPPRTAAAVLGILARRLDVAQTPSVVAALESTSDSVRQAAWEALGSLASAAHVETLAFALARRTDSGELKAGRQALVAICRRAAAPGVTGPAVAAALDQATPVAVTALLPVLPAAGGDAALKAVSLTIEETDGDVRTAAVRALADWPDAGALPRLERVVEEALSELDYVLAFRGYVRLLDGLDVPAARKLDLYAQAMEQARRTEEKKLVLAGLGALQDRAGFTTLRPYLDDKTLCDDAATAIIRLALAVRGEASVEALRAVLAAVTDETVAQRAREALSDVARYAGCIGLWQLAGPYTDNNKGHTAIYPVPFAPEIDPRTVEWQEIAAQEDGRVDLKRILGGSNRCAYLRCNVLLPTATPARLSVGSDDGVKVWLNGRVVHENNVPRPFTWCEDGVDIILLAGANTLMMKITQGGGDWMANARIRDRDGLPIAEMAVELGPAVSVHDAADWQPLFNGRDLDGWQNSQGGQPASGWAVEDGSLALNGKGGYIWTRERFADFVLDLEFNTEGNSGLFFRTDNPKDPVQTGIEMQVHTHAASGRHGVGAIYDLQAPAVNAAKPGWNHVRLTADDNRIIVVLNGIDIIDMDLDRWDQAGVNPDGSKNKFRQPLKAFARAGHIGFQDHGSAVRYRNIRIRRLP